MTRFEQREAPILAAAPEPMGEDRAEIALASSRSHYLWAPGRKATAERL